MYAIIADGGRQYKVELEQELDIDLRDVAEGSELTFDRVLAISSEAGFQLGKPLVAGAVVTAKVIKTGVKGPKVSIQKFRRRKNYRRRTGHRQQYIRVRISKIQPA
jgi:large subunit ribosomal protein L21